MTNTAQTVALLCAAPLRPSPTRLGNRALLGCDSRSEYTVHGLQQDEARLRLEKRMPPTQAHEGLPVSYQAPAGDGLWHTVADDGYVHGHLAWHKQQAHLLGALSAGPGPLSWAPGA
jgi:hypothetical protein